MNLPARSILSCRLFPNKVGTDFTLTDGAPPRIYAAAGHDFRLAFFYSDTELYVPDNVVSLTLSVWKSSTLKLQVSTTQLNTGLTLAQWQAGTHQHALLSVKSTHTSALTAGSYDLTIWGATNDDGADYDVFGVATLQVIDANLTPGTPDPLPADTYVTMEVLNAVFANTVKYGRNPAGKTVSFTSPSGQYAVTHGANDDGTPQQDLETLT